MISFRPIPDPSQKSSALARVQAELQRVLDPITQCPLLAGHLVAGVELTTAGAAVQHGLGRPVVGWFVVGKDADARVWSSGESPNPDKFLLLDASATVTVSLWVF